MTRRARVSALTLPRYITPASIETGDLVRATWTVGDVQITRQGRVARREYEGSMRCFITPEGQELFRWHPAHNTIRVTLIEPAPPAAPEPLFGAELMERAGL